MHETDLLRLNFSVLVARVRALTTDSGLLNNIFTFLWVTDGMPVFYYGDEQFATGGTPLPFHLPLRSLSYPNLLLLPPTSRRPLQPGSPLEARCLSVRHNLHHLPPHHQTLPHPPRRLLLLLILLHLQNLRHQHNLQRHRPLEIPAPLRPHQPRLRPIWRLNDHRPDELSGRDSGG